MWDIDLDLKEGDHPRSRGVYMPQVGCRLTVEGSSPLARGLPSKLAVLDEDCRIIPARAGFTPFQSRVAG